jgi:hypothetical protein
VNELGRVRKPRTGDAEGGRSRRGRYLWSSRKQRGSCAGAFPSRMAAKPPREGNRSTEVINQGEFISLSKYIITNIDFSIAISNVRISCVS